MVTKECLKRIIWILLSAVFLVGCYDDGNYIAEEETIESESSFYYESEEVSLSMVLSLFDIINSDPGIPKEDLVRMCESICNVVNIEFPRLRDVIRALVNLKKIRMRIVLAKTGEIKEGYADWNDGVIRIKEKRVLGDPSIIIHEMIHQLQFGLCGGSAYMRPDFKRNIEFEAYLIMDISMAEAWLKQGAIPDASKLHFLYGVKDTILVMDYINFLCRVYERAISKEEFVSEFNRFAEKFKAYTGTEYSPNGVPSLIFSLWPFVWH